MIKDGSERMNVLEKMRLRKKIDAMLIRIQNQAKTTDRSIEVIIEVERQRFYERASLLK